MMTDDDDRSWFHLSFRGSDVAVEAIPVSRKQMTGFSREDKMTVHAGTWGRQTLLIRLRFNTTTH